MPSDSYFVYILLSPVTGKSYVGQTDNLILRYYRHRDGDSHWTSSRMAAPVMVYWEGFPTRGEAIRKEKYFKSGRGYKKRMRIINSYLKRFHS